jgi:hypothetical protein
MTLFNMPAIFQKYSAFTVCAASDELQFPSKGEVKTSPLAPGLKTTQDFPGCL